MYANSLSHPFVFDDMGTVVANASIRQVANVRTLFSPTPESPTAGRPLVDLSFAINYALGGLNVTGYHLVNIALHAMCAILLFLILRWTFERAGYRGSPPAEILAFLTALLWAVHPINSEVVDYITQRSESLMAMCLLAMLYAGIRAMEPRRRGAWEIAAVIACALGMAAKETMAVGPVLLAAYDRLFLFDSIRTQLRQRRRLYAGLASAYGVLIALMASVPRTTSAGFATATVTPLEYLLNQSIMIVRYARLTIWPHGLVIYYGWPRPLAFGDVWPYLIVIAAGVALTIVALIRRPALGFAGLWFFVTLAPASSIVPVGSEVGAERRMYLPVAALITLAILACVRMCRGLSRNRPATVAGLIALCTAACAAATIERNQEYRSGLTLAYTVLERWPTPIAADMVGTELLRAGRREEAVAYLRQAAGQYAVAHYTLGTELFNEGRYREAIDELQTFIREEPRLVFVHDARLTIGRSFMAVQDWASAVAQFQAAAAEQPSDANARGLLAEALLRQQRFDEAIPQYRAFLTARPRDPAACTGLGIALASTGQITDAIGAFRCAADADPGNPHAHVNLARALLQHRELQAADDELRRAAAIDPSDPTVAGLLQQVETELRNRSRR